MAERRIPDLLLLRAAMDFRALAREEVKRLLLEAGKPYRDGRGRDERHRALEAWVSRRAHELCAEWLAREGPPPAARAPRTPAALLAFLESQPPPAKKAVCFVCHAADHESDSCLAGTQRPRERGASADSHASSKRRTHSSGSAGSVAAALRAAALSGDDSGSVEAAAGAGRAESPAEAAREDAPAAAPVARAPRARRAVSGGGGDGGAGAGAGAGADSSGGGLPADLRRLEHVAASLTAAVAALSAPPALAAAAAASHAAAAHAAPVHLPAGNPFAEVAAAHPQYLLSPSVPPSGAHDDDFSAQLGFHFDS